MGKLGELWKANRVLFLVVVVLLLALVVGSFLWPELVVESIRWIFLGIVVIVLGWILIDYLFGLLKKVKQRKFDAKVVAKEGIEDRKQEWSEWTARMRERGLDRYDLPFYLLVGEPQSGKSVMLHNSDLHFPFGTSRLSGPGGTRGCDWWFTDEAVILDLAGRLFTHEGGASDEAEWSAFLGLLSDYRPLAPANGIILVVPCDSLLADSEDKSAAKAAKIKDALLTLVTRLQAQLPIYVVLTKADKVFGFAETVHRLSSEKRREMFGWSRPADRFDKPYSAEEFREGFTNLVGRAQLLRARSLSEARIPDALGEVDRMYAFPDELRTVQGPLEIYLNRIFKESRLVDLLFFRGVYVTSGLQKGAPIAQACAQLMGAQSEEDSRALESLFTKQKAYFIRDLVRERVFAERGLVRPTSRRVQRSRKIALFGYGAAAALALAGVVFSALYVFGQKKDKVQEAYEETLARVEEFLGSKPLLGKGAYDDLLATLDEVRSAAEIELPAQAELGVNNRDDFRALYRALFEKRFRGTAGREAARNQAKRTELRPADYEEFYQRLNETVFLLGPIDLASDQDSDAFRKILAEVSPLGAGLGSKPTDDEAPIWDFDAALATYEEFTPPDERQLEFTLNPYDVPDLENAAKNVDRYFGDLLAGDIKMGPDAKPAEKELAKVLRLRRLVHDITRLEQENKALEKSCKAVQNCDGILAALAELERFSKQDRVYYTLAEQEITGRKIGKESAAGLNEMRDFIRRTAGISKPEEGPRRWDLVEFGSQQLLHEGGGGRLIRLIPEAATEGDASFIDQARGTPRLPLGKRGDLVNQALSQMLLDRAKQAVGKATASNDVVGRIVLQRTDTDLLHPFDSGPDYESQKRLCNARIFKEREWDHPDELLAAIRDEVKDPPPELARLVADLYEPYRLKYPGFVELATACAQGGNSPAGVGPGFQLEALDHINALRVVLEGLRGHSRPVDESLGKWTAHLNTLCEQHLGELLPQLERHELSVTFDLDVVKALCAGIQAGGDTATRSDQTLSAYMAEIKDQRLARWGSDQSGWSAKDGLTKALGELQTFLAELKRAREQVDCQGVKSLEVDNAFVAKLEDALRFQERELTAAIGRYWSERLRELEESVQPSGGPLIVTAAKAVYESFTPDALARVATDPDSPSLAGVTAGIESSWPLVKELQGRSRYLRDLTDKSELKIDEALALYEASDLPAAAASRELRDLHFRGKLPDDPGDLATVLAQSQKAIDGVGGFQGPFWEYCRGGFGLFIDAASEELGRQYQAEFERKIQSATIWQDRIFHGEGDWSRYREDEGLLFELNRILNLKDGELQLIRARYKYDQVPLPQKGSPFDRFLTELAGFLYGESGGQAISRNVQFVVRPSPQAGSLWERGNWWPRRDLDAPISLPLREQDRSQPYTWVLGSDRDFAMFWGTSAASTDKAEDRWSVVSRLAPLLIAWHLGKRSTDPRIWSVSLDVKGREAPFQLEFNEPLPELPKPFPAGK